MSYSEGPEIPLNTKNPWKPFISGAPGIREYYTSTLCYIAAYAYVADLTSGCVQSELYYQNSNT